VLHAPLAPWWKRLAAILVDTAILGFVVYLAVAAVTIAAHRTTSSQSTNISGGDLAGALLGSALVLSLPAAVYYAAMNGSRRGQTLGKMAMGIAVRDARSGAALGFWRALGRFGITFVFAMALYVPYVMDSLAPLWDRRRQAWHDRVVHSVVLDMRT
jgi:uncharacterized RDD family membrane protein YckC